ncbi:MAG: hypothetical protein ABIG61_01520 [Planctomycetota bacterium]
MYGKIAKNMFMLVLVSTLFGLAVELRAVVRTREQPASVDESRMISEAGEDIRFKLVTILNVVNSGETLQDNDVKVVKNTLAESKKYLVKFDTAQQCDYYLLSAWTNYYAGRMRTALDDAEKAFQSAENNQDAQATRLAMAILNKDYRVVGELGQSAESSIFSARPQPSRASRGRRGEQGPSSQTLDVKPELINPDLFGKAVETMELHCLNGSTFAYKPGQNALCVLFWSLSSDAEKQADEKFATGVLADEPSRRDRYRRGQVEDDAKEEFQRQTSAFGKLFLLEFENSKTRFLAVNIDDVQNKAQVVGQLFKNSWPWAQVMADDPKNSVLTQFKNLAITQPTLAIIAPDGKICYAGQASGFLPRMVLSQAVSEISPSREPSVSEPVLPEETNSTRQQEKTTRSPEAQPTAAEESDEQFNPHAEQLYQTAVGLKKAGVYINYRKMVDLCRTILREYPDSPYAEKARQLLREMPPRYRQMYNITDEELGI